MKEKCILEVYNQEGKLEKIEVIKYFSLKRNNKDYIIYKPLEKSSNKDTLIFSAEIEESDDNISLLPIENKEIKELIQEIAENIFKGEKYNG